MTFPKRLRTAIDGWPGGGNRAFAREMADRGVRGGTYRSLLSYLRFTGGGAKGGGTGTTPSPKWIEEAAQVAGVRIEWLRDGKGEQSLAEELLAKQPDDPDSGDFPEIFRDQMNEARVEFAPFLLVMDDVLATVFLRTALDLFLVGLGQLTWADIEAAPDEYVEDYELALRVCASWVFEPIQLLHVEAVNFDSQSFNDFAIDSLLVLGRLIRTPDMGITMPSLRERMAEKEAQKKLEFTEAMEAAFKRNPGKKEVDQS